MGLDMYLKAEKYVGGWKHSTAPERSEYADIFSALGLSDFRCEGSPSATVSITVAYWRKANAIHKWFVDNCQDGKDEGDTHEVSREQLTELRDLCKRLLAELKTEPGQIHTGTTYHPGGKEEETYREGRVIANPESAASLLPTQGGFFFGSTAYDEGYISDLEDTVKQLSAVLDNPRFADFSFEYRASW